MLSSLLFSAPYIIFYLYAIHVCRQKREIAPLPSKVTLFVCGALLAQMSLTLLLHGLLQTGAINVNRFFLFVMDMSRIVGWGSLITVLFCVFAWRSQKAGVYKKPAILTGVSLLLRIVSYQLFHRILPWQDMSPASFVVYRIVLTTMNIGADILLLRAIFEGRSASDHVATPIPASTVSTPTGEAPSKPVPEKGMFKEEDYVPYVVGVMILGGLIAIPLVYSGIMKIRFETAIFPSLISCGIFSYSHTKRGHFLIGRYLGYTLLAFVTIMRATLQTHGNGQPMFMAGGVLGILVMTGCGWLGILIARALRGKPKVS